MISSLYIPAPEAMLPIINVIGDIPVPYKDPADRAAQCRRYRAANLEKLQAYHRVYQLQWRDAHLEKVQAADRESHSRLYAANPGPRRAREAAKYHADPAADLAEQKKRHRRNPVIRMLQHAKARAKAGGYPFAITAADVPVPTHCPYLGIPLVFGDGRVCDGSPSLDRTHGHLGYVSGNVEVISYRANRLKNDIRPDEVARMYDALRKRLQPKGDTE